MQLTPCVRCRSADRADGAIPDLEEGRTVPRRTSREQSGLKSSAWSADDNPEASTTKIARRRSMSLGLHPVEKNGFKAGHPAHTSKGAKRNPEGSQATSGWNPTRDQEKPPARAYSDSPAASRACSLLVKVARPIACRFRSHLPGPDV